MKKNINVSIVIIAAIVLCGALNVEAVPNPGAILWDASPQAFVTSLYVGVLGRQPESQAVVNGWAEYVNDKPISRLRVFWAFIGSIEYQGSSWAKQKKEYKIYREMDHNRYRYSVSKGPLGAKYFPQDGPYTFGVAMAVRGYHETFYSRR